MKKISFKYQLIVVVITSIVLEMISISSFVAIQERNYPVMLLCAFIGPFTGLPMSHFCIEATGFKERFLITAMFSVGYCLGIYIIRPFILT